jgi:hypothetical protein
LAAPSILACPSPKFPNRSKRQDYEFQCAYRIFDSPKAAAAAKAKGIVDRSKAASIPAGKAAKPEPKPAPAPDAKVEAKPEPKPAPAPDASSITQTDLTPKLVERVHALYEELGRQDVLAVQELEREQQRKKEKSGH